MFPGVAKRRERNSTSVTNEENDENNNNTNDEKNNNNNKGNSVGERKRCYNDLYGCIVEENDEIYTTHLFARHCHCQLNYSKFFFSEADVPSSESAALTLLYKCEYHELLRCLPPRMQNYPWHLAFDTARDGFSLRNFYRCMEENALQYHAACVGVLLVTFRDEVNSNVDVTEKETLSEKDKEQFERQRLQKQHEDNINDVKTSVLDNMSTTNNEEDYSKQKTIRSERNKYGVIGCFTAEAPSLNVHSEHAFFGNAETFVFRFNAPPSRLHEENTSIDNTLHVKENNRASEKAVLNDKENIKSLEEKRTTFTAESGRLENSKEREAFAKEQEQKAKTEAVTAVNKCASPVPMLDVYRWNKSSNVTHFILCRHDIFSVGGGKDGAALTFDASLQFGTSSHHCRSFNSPALFNDVQQSYTEKENINMKSNAEEDKEHSNITTTTKTTERNAAHALPHSEFMIVRMAWFAIHHNHTIEFRQSLTQSSEPTINTSNSIGIFAHGGGGTGTFNFETDNKSIQESKNNVAMVGHFSSNIDSSNINERKTFREKFEAEKASRCLCGRQACSLAK